MDRIWWMDGVGKNGWNKGRQNSWMDGRMMDDRWKERWKYGQMQGEKNGWTEGWKKGT